MMLRLVRGVFLIGLLMLGACASPVVAGPPAEEFGDLAEPLNKEITVSFIGTPLSQAVDTLRRELALNFLIRGEVNESFRITLNIEALPASQVLELIGLASDTDWYIDQGVVVIASEDFVRRRSIETRVYNISDLIQSVPNYLGPTLNLNDALSNTNSGGSSARQSESFGSGGGGRGSLFGDDDDGDLSESTLSRAEKVGMITELIRMTCGDPDEWLDEESSMTELSGSLVVRTTPDVHEQIESLLTQLSDARGQMVGVEGQFFAVPRDLLDGLEGRLVLGPDALTQLMEAMQEAGVQRISAGRTVCTNGQRVYVYAGHDTTFLSDIEPIPNTAAVDPTLSNARNGVVIDVLPTITLDGEAISLAVRTDNIDGSTLRTTDLPVGSVQGGATRVRLEGSVHGEVDSKDADVADADLTGRVEQEGQIGDGGEAVVTGSVALEMPENDMLTHRTNVRVPDGGGVILSGVSQMYADVDAQDLELVLILRARIVE
ncbi:MAG: hypothetical protein AAGH88_16055 [Planctomycetota bacterium]